MLPTNEETNKVISKFLNVYIHFREKNPNDMSLKFNCWPSKSRPLIIKC